MDRRRRRFDLEGDPYDQQRVFVATGGGLNLRTPVGPIKFSVGYKLNPSVADLVDAGDALLAAQEHRPLGELHQRNSRTLAVPLGDRRELLARAAPARFPLERRARNAYSSASVR